MPRRKGLKAEPAADDDAAASASSNNNHAELTAEAPASEMQVDASSTAVPEQMALDVTLPSAAPVHALDAPSAASSASVVGASSSAAALASSSAQPTPPARRSFPAELAAAPDTDDGDEDGDGEGDGDGDGDGGDKQSRKQRKKQQRKNRRAAAAAAAAAAPRREFPSELAAPVRTKQFPPELSQAPVSPPRGDPYGSDEDGKKKHQQRQRDERREREHHSRTRKSSESTHTYHVPAVVRQMTSTAAAAAAAAAAPAMSLPFAPVLPAQLRVHTPAPVPPKPEKTEADTDDENLAALTAEPEESGEQPTRRRLTKRSSASGRAGGGGGDGGGQVKQEPEPDDRTLTTAEKAAKNAREAERRRAEQALSEFKQESRKGLADDDVAAIFTTDKPTVPPTEPRAPVELRVPADIQRNQPASELLLNPPLSPIFGGDVNQFFFVQLPGALPSSVLPDAAASEQLPQGQAGKLFVHRSGALSLQVGGVSFSVTSDSGNWFTQGPVVLDTTSRRMAIGDGRVHRLICSPDVASLQQLDDAMDASDTDSEPQ